MKNDYKIIKVYPVNKSNSSCGNYSIDLDIEWPNGMRANTFLFFFRKAEAVKEYYKLISSL